MSAHDKDLLLIALFVIACSVVVIGALMEWLDSVKWWRNHPEPPRELSSGAD